MYDRIWYGDFSFFWGGELGFASYPASWRPPLSVQRLLATAAPHPTQTKSIVATNSAASWRGVQSFTMVVVIYLQWCVLTMCMKNVLYGIWEVRSIDVIFKTGRRISWIAKMRKRGARCTMSTMGSPRIDELVTWVESRLVWNFLKLKRRKFSAQPKCLNWIDIFFNCFGMII